LPSGFISEIKTALRHLPPAAQLTLVSGLRAMEDVARLRLVNQLKSRPILPVSAVAKLDRFATGVYGPERRELDLNPAGSKKGHRGIFLVVTVFAASVLCIWTIGWWPSSYSMYGAQVASSGANPEVLFPQTSSGQVSVLTPTSQGLRFAFRHRRWRHRAGGFNQFHHALRWHGESAKLLAELRPDIMSHKDTRSASGGAFGTG
jgi:hypothetical protein